MRGALLSAALAIATLLSVGIQFALTAKAGFDMGDFHAFDCAAYVATHRANPYHVEPLRACEAATGLSTFFAKEPGVAVPAPLPGYAIAALMPLTLLPSAVSTGLWLALLVVASALSVVALGRMAAVPWPVPLSALALSLGASSIPFGEIVPIAIAAICIAAYFAQRQQWRASAIAAAIAMVEPHLGLPVCLALFIWAPATRVTLIVAAVVLAAISVVVLGAAVNLEYITTVLPAHALSEVGRDTQYSLTSVLASLGVSDGMAVRVGMLSYVAMLAVGIVVAGLLAKSTRNAAFLACVPPAFAVFGGTFIHVTQIAAAVPAAVLLIGYVRPSLRNAAVIALLLLAVPWNLAWSPAFGLAPAFPIAYLAWYYWGGSLRAVALAAIAGGLLVVGTNRALLLTTGHPPLRALPRIASNLPEASWSAFTAKDSHETAVAWLVRLPTWGGLALLLVLAIGEGRALRAHALASEARS